MKVLFTIPLLLLCAGTYKAHAEVVVNPNVTYFSRNLDQTTGANQVSNKLNVLTVDGKAGYIFDFGLFVGGQAVFEAGSISGSSNIRNYFMGPSVGYSCDITGLFITATYHVLGASDLGSYGEYSKSSGLQIDLGYPMELTENIKFGPQISWKSIKNTNGTNGLADTTTKQFTPYFGMWFYF